jgi:hypothetical protein
MTDWPSPVRLQYATAQSFGVSGMTFSYTYLRVKVQNIGYEKRVILHGLEGSQWRDYVLPWNGWYGDYDVFATPNARDTPLVSRFAISYTVNGRTYWDNNFAADYRPTILGSVVGGSIALRSASLAQSGGGGQVSGELYVDNLSYQKLVGVRISTDGGSVWSDVNATYSGVATEGTYTTVGVVAERWAFLTPVFPTSWPGNVRIAAFYHDLQHGASYWDNNFGRNYTLSGFAGVSIE